ncbi:malto-oligosyltrehalose synthase [Auritidibacter ignavus]|uniref:malto-oligosyltrehalose synthase n=1 Tax=Auritidibacter ignavus TaxID=678932 RepID=UPI002FE631DB
MTAPTATYRVQLSDHFTLADAGQLWGYLRRLGVTGLYLSPILQANSGSDHGYDVVDPTCVDASRGGAQSLQALAEQVHADGGQLIIDVVPNHVGVGVPAENPWWWDVLAHGPTSRYARFFDIDWAAGDDRLVIPVLGEGTAQDPGAERDRLCVRESTAEAGAGADQGITDLRLCYDDNEYPLAEDTDLSGQPPQDDPVAYAAWVRGIHDQQHYRLEPWRDGEYEVNYRRFFAINELAALRIEDPIVFQEATTEIRRWFADRVADGLRLDHIDGLADPGQFLRQLRDHIGDNAWVVAEKILEPGEALPESFPVQGTCGYDTLQALDRVLIDPRGTQVLAGMTASEAAETPRQHDPVERYRDLVYQLKHRAVTQMLTPDLHAVARLVAPDLGRESDDQQLLVGLTTLMCAFPVYRSYVPLGEEYLHQAAAVAVERDPSVAEVVGQLMPVLADPQHPGAIRFQQTTSMAMAKGVEDTAFYRFSLLSSANEVGADPAQIGISVQEFHDQQRNRLTRWPETMTTISTHDTKRSEDVRARIHVLSECAQQWAETFAQLTRMITDQLPRVGDDLALWKIVVETGFGAQPLSNAGLEYQRWDDYAVKAARESGAITSWTEQDQEYEHQLGEALELLLDDAHPVGALWEQFTSELVPAAVSNQLSLKLLHLVSVGVPDIYQGTEIVFPTMVDPDNRCAVDFAYRADLLDELDRRVEALGSPGLTPPPDPAPGAGIDRAAWGEFADLTKLWITTQVLHLRSDCPDWFTEYIPLEVHSDQAGDDHVIGCIRGQAIAVATRWPLGLERQGGWDTTTSIVVPKAECVYLDLLTGTSYRSDANRRIEVADVLHILPVALLAPQDLVHQDDPDTAGDTEQAG